MYTFANMSSLSRSLSIYLAPKGAREKLVFLEDANARALTPPPSSC